MHTGRLWSIMGGRPVLFAGLGTPRILPDTHLSNEMPELAEALMRETDGWVLHLSAGGTPRRRDNVVEVEAAIFRNTDIVADAHALPFADASFDALIALNAFEHYHLPLLAAREIHRVLRPGGRVVI